MAYSFVFTNLDVRTQNSVRSALLILYRNALYLSLFLASHSEEKPIRLKNAVRLLWQHRLKI